MSYRHPQHRQAKKVPSLKSRFFIFVLLTAFAGYALSTTAQPVYRCGDQYSSSARCHDGSTPEVQDPRTIDQQKAQDHLSHGTQAEADALEKLRLKMDPKISHVPPLVSPGSSKGFLPSQETTETGTLGSQQPHARKRKTGPYFTAKDGSANSKKKAPTSVKKKANADAPAKP
jgi:hypothetical protein